MMRRKKSRFLNFCFSFLPGAAEMYMGFFKMGASLMAAFFGLFAFSSLLGIGELMYIMAIVWFYGFFHANHLAGMPQQEYDLQEDGYLFHVADFQQGKEKLMGKYCNIVSVVLIFLGVLLCLRAVFHLVQDFLPQVIINVYYSICGSVPQLIVGAGIIALGYTMMKGKKKELL